MLSNFNLEELAGFYKLPLVGIFMKNEMPKKLIDGCYIINLQSSTQGRTHWTAMVVWKKMSYYFDSFGAPPPVEIINFTKKKEGRAFAL